MALTLWVYYHPLKKLTEYILMFSSHPDYLRYLAGGVQTSTWIKARI